MDPKTVSTVMTVALVLYMLLQPVFGALSDKIGRRNNMLLFSGLAMVGSVPLLTLIGGATSSFAAFALIMVGLVIASLYKSISGGGKAELFPAEVRALGVGCREHVKMSGLRSTSNVRSGADAPWAGWASRARPRRP